MRPRLVRVAAGAILAAALAAGSAVADDASYRPPMPASVPEPEGLWPGPMHGRTPATLTGATVIDAAKVAALHASHAVMIDVAYPDRKPTGQPSDLPWSPIHRSIPGATWMPGAGSGTHDAAFVKAFDARVEALTGGDKSKPIVTFCHPQRWGSWNAAKRLTELGYHNVYWFPGGAEGWMAGHRTADLDEDKAWKAALPSADLMPVERAR